MVKSNVQHGFLGFFDILGYQNYLENTDPYSAANKVIKVLNNLKNEIPKELKKEYTDSVNLSAIKKLNFLIFSDTILISLESKRGISINEKLEFMIRSGILNFASMLLAEHLFKYGLPFRGVINYGDYIIEDYCFAGNIIVDSYKLTNKLDVATVVCAEKYTDIINNTISEVSLQIDKVADDKLKKTYLNIPAKLQGLYSDFFSEYLIPFNDGEEKKMKTLNLYTALKLSKDDSSDISQFVHNIFWKHKKDIPKSVQNKVDNTIKLLRYLKNH